MKKATVAVVGTGPTGLSMLKVLREDGFQATAFERRPGVAGLWSYSENPAYTTALRRTEANISKYPCGFADFPIPEKYPPYMRAADFQEFMEDYAKHFDLLKDIVFNATVKRVRRNEDDTMWRVEVERDGQVEAREFDKVALCHGYQTHAKLPTFEGQDRFEGTLIHSQAYRTPDQFKGKNVVVVGMSASAGEVVPDLAVHAAKVYVSHRHGAIPIKRWQKGTPADLSITWRRRQYSFLCQRYAPRLARLAADLALRIVARRSFGPLDPAWRLEPYQSLTLKLTGTWETVIGCLRDGTAESVHGIRRFLPGGRRVELLDGRVLDDIDAVVCCTGYAADWSVAPFVETSRPTAHGYEGEPIYRMYMNMLPPRYADSCALLCYSAFGKSNGFTFADLSAMAISNVWRGVSPLPSRDEMERHIDSHQEWVASRWRQDPTIDTSCVKQWEFQGWLHRSAGTGMESLGWGPKGWAFWWRDRKLYNLMNHGVETAHAFRYFETGKRKTWDGARDAIIRVNEEVKVFPIKEMM